MSKGILVCLSYTGNTEQICRAVLEGMSPLLEKCEMVSLRQANPEILKGYDLIGICSPVRLAKMPVELQQFIGAMEGLTGRHCFVANTHAALPAGFMRDCVSALREAGLTVVGFKNWYCSVYLPYVPKPYFTDGHPDAEDLEEARRFGREMVERSQKIKNGQLDLIQKLPEGQEYDDIYGGKMSGGQLPAEVMQARAQGFKLDSQKCIHCNFCQELCPSRSIDFQNELSIFGKCDQCWLCEQTCPAGAISFNYPPLHKSHNVVVMKGFVPHLQRAAAAGRFRPLVRDEDIGWETPLFKTHNPPRFKIVDEEYYMHKGQQAKDRI
jgi:ferredoxin